MAVAKSGARATKSLATLSSGGCGTALPHHNHQKELFGEAPEGHPAPSNLTAMGLCNRHASYCQAELSRRKIIYPNHVVRRGSNVHFSVTDVEEHSQWQIM